MKRTIIHLLAGCGLLGVATTSAMYAQVDSTLLKPAPADTSQERSLNMDAVYNRPFMQGGELPISIGGYVEADYQYMGTDGISEGHSFRVPRMTLFVASSIGQSIRFFSEVEFEEGGKEIAIEYAAVDFLIHPLLNLRGGIVMNPIGGFNQNHDGPKWEFVERPIAMTQMLPATWSNPGFGIYGKEYLDEFAFGYELYLTNGFNNAIVSNSENRTFLPAAKENAERFEESSNGKPLLTAKVVAGLWDAGELGFSYMGGVYNTFADDGLVLDDMRRLDIWAVDFRTRLPIVNTSIIGEWAWVTVDVAPTYSQQFGSLQRGGFVDFVQPIVKVSLFGYENAVLSLACRLEYVDWNVGTFNETGGNIADDLWAVVPAVSFRPTAQSVVRLNYRYMEQHDVLGNPPSHTGGIQIGASTYF
jgi:hypothetical protein